MISTYKRPSALIASAVVFATLATAGCDSSSENTTDGDVSSILGNDGGTSGPVDPLDDVTNAQADDSVGLYFRGSPPPAVGSITLNPLSVDQLESTVIRGGSIIIPIEASAPFSIIYVVANQEGTAAQGYFQILLPEAVTQTVLQLTYDTDLPNAVPQQVDVQVGSTDGSVSASNSATLLTRSVGTGEVQISVSWDKNSDVDLHVTEPGGERINFINDRSDAGGELDLDSNAGCLIDGIRNENISYAGVEPPLGSYTVEVDYFDDCEQGTTSYIVTILNRGVQTTFSGTLSDDTGTRQPVTTFEVR